MLRALIRGLVIEARLHVWIARAHTAYGRPVERDLRRPAHESPGGAVGVPMLHVTVRDEHDAHAVRARLAQQWRILQPLPG